MLQALAIDDIALTQSCFVCLHVTEFKSEDTPFGELTGPAGTQIEDLERRIVHRCQQERLTYCVAENATTTSGTFFKQATPIGWLTENTELTNSQAAVVIDEFPVHVAPKMCQNARNPTQFLGLAAAISRQPDVLIYSTPGMDPRGIALMHVYAPERYTDGCLIHISTRELTNVVCDHSGKCLLVNVNSQIDDA